MQSSSTPRTPIAPPQPAPYLANAPQLSDELLQRLFAAPNLESDEEGAIQTELDRLCTEIRERRSAYEAEHGVRIVPERPVAE